MNNSEVSYFVEKAKESLEAKKLFQFIKYISIAEYLANNNHQQLKMVLAEEVNGFYLMNQYEKVLEVTEEALKVIDDRETRLELMYKKGVALGRLGVFKEAAEVFKGLIRDDILNIKIESYISLAWVDIHLHETHSDTRYLSEAKECCFFALDLSREFDTRLYVRALRNLGWAYWAEGDYQNALQTFLNANELTNGKNANALNNVASVYISLGQADMAVKYIDRAEEIAEAEKKYCEAAECNFLRGRIAAEVMEDYLKAKDYYLIAYDYFVEASAINDAFKMLNRIAALDQKINDESYTILANRLGGFYLNR